MSQKSLLGWGVLAVALAVPAVLVWNLRVKMKSVPPLEIRMKTPPSGGAFGAGGVQSGAQGAAGSQAASSAPAAGTEVSSASAAGPASADPAQAPSQAQAPSPQAGETPSPATPPQAFVPSDASASGASQPSASRGPADPDAVEYSPNTTRDPMVSPFDLKRLAREAEIKRMSQQEVEEAVKPKSKPKKAQETPIEQRLEVYGVVATPNGIEALVNDRRVREGDTVLGAKVKKITTGRIRFEYRGRVFEKKVSQ